MIRSSLRLAAFVTVLAIAGCATPSAPPPEEPGPTLGQYVFDYSITARNKVHVVQVFDDGKKTFVQFTSLRDIKPTFRVDPLAPELKFERNGSYAVLASTYSAFVITVGRSTAQVLANRAATPAVPASAPASAPEAASVPVVSAAGA